MQKQVAATIVFMLLFGYMLQAQTALKVMSYNIRLNLKSDGENWWENRKDRVASLMNYYEADFIGMQEVLQNQLDYLEDHLPGYAYIGVGRDDGKQAGEYSCLFYNTGKYSLVKQSTFWLSPTPDTPSKGWDAALNRVCTYGLFRNKKTKQHVWVFNTHFDHIGKNARLESAKLIIEKIKELNTKGYPVVLTGDFNSRPEEDPVKYVLTYLRNSRTVAKLVYGNADTWNAFKFGEQPSGCIDYIFVSGSPKITVTKFATITDSYDRKYPSDHFPVMATLQFKK